MLILESGQTCTKGMSCPYNENGQCQGTNSGRATRFECTYTEGDSICKDGQCRNINDVTGKMKIIRG